VNDARSGRPSNVVPFVDRATLEIRRQAVRRVREAGIFRLPPEPDVHGKDAPQGEKP
jgi:hypothetical protein